VTFLPPDVPEKIDDLVRGTLRTSVARFTIAKSPLLGVFIVVNDNGVLLSPLALEDEVRLFKSLGLNVEVLNTKYTAVSNLILANNKTALVSPLLEPQLRKVVADVLGVEVIVDTVANNPLVGALAVLNSRGLLVAPEATDEDVKKLSEYFKVRVDVGTVNKGKSFLRGGIVVNDHGALVGDETAGPELMRITQVLG
jgi:translation initiation factor 6